MQLGGETHACLFSWKCVGMTEIIIHLWKEWNKRNPSLKFSLLFILLLPFQRWKMNWGFKEGIFLLFPIHKDRLSRGFSLLPPSSFSYNIEAMFKYPYEFQKFLYHFHIQSIPQAFIPLSSCGDKKGSMTSTNNFL